ncbi:SDR family oxidoreductase [Bacillus sp. V2I10]|uniref:SDR family oxidoreductase n=1 Tax=Bacillus sp. V2I10 TaxID=3042276 RepID=UPI00278B6EBB|nr:SDR family oxidoreductase [Bacillus sp. V2I10]MDQ0862234.1 NAD(P)-dependent dehydrogenase (short-subunit alcohol dehydrogenase family) [Bacillus sp. V2I10]
MKISEQIALVTGANRGLGKELAIELISRGATVYAGARNPENIQIPGAIPLQLDITDPNSVAAAAKIAGDVTLLINNAGVMTGASLINGNLDDIHAEFDTNLFGTLSVVRAFVPKITINGGGTILNILSALSWFTSANSGSYSATKSAEWTLTNAIRLELAEQNIRVAGLHVGYIDTELTAQIAVPKLNATDVAKIAIDGIEADKYEILVDEVSRKVQKGLSGGVSALYPQFS